MSILLADYTNCSGLGWVTDWMTVNQAYSAVVIDADTGADPNGSRSGQLPSDPIDQANGPLLPGAVCFLRPLRGARPD